MQNAAQKPEHKLSQGEAKLLRLLRTGNFERVELKLRDGQLKTLLGTAYQSTTDLNEITKLIEAYDYQRITVIREGGAIRGIKRTQIEKLTD